MPSPYPPSPATPPPAGYSRGSTAGPGPRTYPCHILVPRFLAAPASRLVLVGNLPQLGNWAARGALQLQPSPQNPAMLSAVVHLPINTKVEAKVRWGCVGEGERERVRCACILLSCHG